MSIVAQIRTTLQKCGEPMTMDQLTEANGWSKEDRARAYVLVADYKKRGEIATAIEEGKVTYALVVGYVPKPSGRGRGAPIHIGRADKTPKPTVLEPMVPPVARAADAQRARHESDVALTRTLIDNVSGGELYGRANPRSDFDLGKRIDVVVEDIQELLTDALDADHGKELIKQLVAANHSLNRAARLYPRK